MKKLIKRLGLILILLMVNLINYGQDTIPKRIVYQQEAGIFLNKEQEVWVLQQLEWKKLYKNNLDSLFKFTFAEQEKTYYLIQAYEKLYLFYDKLEIQANEEYKLRLAADKKAQEALSIADRENKRKKKWRKIAIYEGIALTGIITTSYILFIK